MTKTEEMKVTKLLVKHLPSKKNFKKDKKQREHKLEFGIEANWEGGDVFIVVLVVFICLFETESHYLIV